MLKKYSAIIAVLALVLSLMLALVGCGGGSGTTDNAGAGNEGTGNEGGNGAGTENGLKLVDGGDPTFQFVFSKDISTAARTLANSTIKAINKVMGEDAKSDYETDENATEIEIIIGTPSYRGTEYAIDYHYLGPEGYAVKVVGTKVLVLYGSDNAVGKALDHLKETVFGITSKTKELKEVVVTEDKLIEAPQTFTLTSATVAGYDLKDYVFEYPTSIRSEVQNIQNNLYNKVGIWLPKGTASATQKAVIVREIENGGEGTTPEGFRVYVDENANLVVETEFMNKLSEGLTKFFNETILKSGTTEITFSKDYTYNKFDARNIYYEDFGAKGNGVTDDFGAMKSCHDYANKYGHTVNGKAGAQYRIISKDKGSSSITIQTDTNWNGCKIILDDSTLTNSDAAWWSFTFNVANDYANVSYSESAGNLPVQTISKGAQNIGWAPGYRAMVVFYDSTRKVYIRYGTLADDGQKLTEFVIVDENGNIDPSTPMNWDFTKITSIDVVRLNTDSVTINGGEYDEQNGIDNRAVVETRFFKELTTTPEGYRHGAFSITKSNVTFKNIVHEITGEYDVNYGCSYNGFTNSSYADNVRFENITFQRYRIFNTNYRSYEVRATMMNNIGWYNCDMSNFFGDEGEVYTYGMMGTNFSKNMTFDHVEFNTFDAHCGSYNVNIRNSQLVYLSIIGVGQVTVEDTTFYVTRKDYKTHAIWLRTDYGSHYDGDINVKNVTIKYADYLGKEPEVALISAVWNNHYFGYDTVLGRNITVDNVMMQKIEFGIGADGKRWEKNVQGQNKLYLFTSNMYAYTGVDISSNNVNGGINLNPYKGPETITITNCKDLTWVLPTAKMPQFKNTVVTVDGVKQY